MAGRFVSARDNRIIDQFNKELVEDVIGQNCVLYKINSYNTKTNIYGESLGGGKVYNKPVQLPCIITHEDIDWNVDLFGPDSGQNVTFAFLRNMLIEKCVLPEVGDIVEWNYAYFEINAINENKLLGGDTEKNHDLQAICHMTRRSKINIEKRVK